MEITEPIISPIRIKCNECECDQVVPAAMLGDGKYGTLKPSCDSCGHSSEYHRFISEV